MRVQHSQPRRFFRTDRGDSRPRVDLDAAKRRTKPGSARYQGDVDAAHERAVRHNLESVARFTATVARSVLAAHYGHSERRGGKLPSPTIVVIEGRKLDWWVMMSALNKNGHEDPWRAIGIEYGKKGRGAVRPLRTAAEAVTAVI